MVHLYREPDVSVGDCTAVIAPSPPVVSSNKLLQPLGAATSAPSSHAAMAGGNGSVNDSTASTQRSSKPLTRQAESTEKCISTTAELAAFVKPLKCPDCSFDQGEDSMLFCC